MKVEGEPACCSLGESRVKGEAFDRLRLTKGEGEGAWLDFAGAKNPCSAFWCINGEDENADCWRLFEWVTILSAFSMVVSVV
jgi:hypothetical protein